MKKKLKLYLLRLFRLKSSTHKIALGMALGFIPNWVPTFGTGPILSLALAKLFRVNVSSALMGGVSGTFIWPLLFYMNYKVGSLVLFQKDAVINIDEIPYADTPEKIFDLSTMGTQFITGMVINCIVFSFIIYGIFYILFKKYRVPLLTRVRRM